MKPISHEGGKRWMVQIPRKLSVTGKRTAKYFPNRNQAWTFIKTMQYEWREHGRSGVTDEERSYISMARTELGNLSRLPEVLRHWRLTGPDAVVKTTIQDAVAKYLEHRATQDISRRTVRDSKSALRHFTLKNAWRYVHEITTSDIHEYLNTKSAGDSRRTIYKQLKLFFRWAKTERVIAVDPMENIKPPVVKPKEAELYSPEDFERLLRTADAIDSNLVPFLALSGFGMMRSGELISQYADKPVLRWENVIWERGLVDVPEPVAKQTRRTVGNRCEFPICDAIAHWLEPFKGRTGRIVDATESAFRARLTALFTTAGVTRIDNGLRKSAISHYIGAHPSDGVVLTARYAGNSESISRRHYVSWVGEERGAAWFGIRRVSRQDEN